jgi:hypothetical protein
MAKKIIDRMAKMSEQYGTHIKFKDGLGIWMETGK